MHKETLTSVENALPNRSNLDVEIFGMEGVPEDVLQAHNQRVLGQLQQAETERRAATGNPPPGTGTGTKKPKFESPSEMKKRLAEHKARLAEQNAGGSSGGGTPNGFSQRPQSPSLGHSPGPYVSFAYQVQEEFRIDTKKAGSPSYPTAAQPYSGPPTINQPFPSYSQPYGPPSNSFSSQPFSPSISQGYPSPNIPTYASQGSQFPSTHQQHSTPYQSQHQTNPPNPYGAPPPSVQTHGGGPSQTASLPPRPGSLPPAPGLPQRPSFGAPPVNNYQLQQMHHAQSQPSPMRDGQRDHQDGGHASKTPGENNHTSGDATSLDELVAGAANAAAKLDVNSSNPGDKKSKKEKMSKLVYSDNEISPEEKMAGLPRYAFVPERKGETVLGNAIQATVTGVVQN